MSCYNFVHDTVGSCGGDAGAGTFSSLPQFVDDGLDERLLDVLRRGQSLPEIADRVVILVDDGIAMGSTMRAGVLLCRNRKAKEIIAASPVAGPSPTAAFENIADGVVILEKPRLFRPVAQVYVNWYNVSDEEVIRIMESWDAERRAKD